MKKFLTLFCVCLIAVPLLAQIQDSRSFNVDIGNPLIFAIPIESHSRAQRVPFGGPVNPHAANTPISFVTTAAGCGQFSSVGATYTITAGDTSVVVTSVTPATVAVTSISGGGTYAQRATATNGVYKVEIWSTGAGAATSAASANVSFSGSATQMIVIGADYAGVAALGNTNTATGAGANPTINVTTQDANNFAVAGFVNSLGSMTSGTGNLRMAPGCGAPPGSALNDNTAAGAGTVTNTVTHTADTWAAAVLELRN